MTPKPKTSPLFPLHRVYRGLRTLLFAVAVSLLTVSAPAFAQGGGTVVIIKTNMGEIKAQLDDSLAPESAKNFLAYVDEKFYDGTVFHRVINKFMIQGGGFDAQMNRKPTKAPIKNEARKDLKNKRGTLAMARTNDPNSATSQFFINHVDNAFLDFKDPSPRGIGYAVFGRVIEGIEVVDKIATVKTGYKSRMKDVPVQPVVIESIRRAE